MEAIAWMVGTLAILLGIAVFGMILYGAFGRLETDNMRGYCKAAAMRSALNATSR